MKKGTKSVISILLSMLMLLSLGLFAHALAPGDVDGNGEVNSADARLCLRRAVDLETYEKGSDKFIACDVDGNGEVTSADARKILRAAVDLEDLGCAHEWEVDEKGRTWRPEKKMNGVPSGNHYRRCTKCNTVETEVCSYGEKQPQNPKNPGPATCTQSFTWYQQCTVCNGARVGTDPKLNHANKVLVEAKSKLAGYNDAGEIDCTVAGWNYYECPDCGQNGDTLAELLVAVPAPGHTASATDFSSDQDIVCTRCGKTLMPSFNTLVNGIKSVPGIRFSELDKQENGGNVRNFNFHISAAAQALLRLAGESITEDDILEMFTEEMQNEEPVYMMPYMESIFIQKYFPIHESMNVSELESRDIKSINIQELSEVDFISELPDEVWVKINESTSRKQNLEGFKALAKTGNIQKITVELVDESYSKIKNSSEPTALMRAGGVDIRAYINEFTQDESDDGFELKMTCNDVTSACKISYYFLVTTEGDETVYTPVAAKYVTAFNIDQHIDFSATIEGMDIMNGNIDLNVINTETNYYLFSIR